MAEGRQKLSENLEDYLEIISALSSGNGSARTTDIAAALNVKKPSVTAALNVLSEKGLVTYERYKPVMLTQEGQKLANKVMHKHRLLSNFFTEILGVSPADADEAACKMEHALDDSMMKKLVTFLKGISVTMCSDCDDSSGECTKTCPHALTLDKLEKGDKAIILTMDEDGKHYKSLSEAGVLQSASVKVLDKPDGEKSMKIKTIYGEFFMPIAKMKGVRVKRI